MRTICQRLESKLNILFQDNHDKISAREDSRAFGAMIEKMVITYWEEICSSLNFEFMERPGRKSLYDCACKISGKLWGFDVKTKELGKKPYSDGGVCAVGNLLKFLVNTKGIFAIIEFGHSQSQSDTDQRILQYIRVAPIHCLPENIFRIENLGTGQIRFDKALNDIWTEIQWDRSYKNFFDIFTKIVLQHYENVKNVSQQRIESIKEFQKSDYTQFKLH